MPADRPTTLGPGDGNAISGMLGVLGDEWNLLIMQQALMGANRYTEFTSRLPISNSVLTRRLRMLVEQGLLTSEYRSTGRGRSLWPVLLSIWEWERVWVTEHNDMLPAMLHIRCGELFAPLLRCRSCDAAVNDDVEFTMGPSGHWARSAPATRTRRRSEADAAGGRAGLFPQTMAVIGNRWAAALMVAAFLGTRRFTDFQAQLGVPPSLLAERLQTFCDIGVLTARRSERDAYLLSAKGRALAAVVVTALQWAQRWYVAPEGPAITFRHRACGGGLDAELACNRCSTRLAGAQVAVIPVAATGNP